MEKFNNLAEYLEANNITREDIKELLLRSSLNLLLDGSQNFDDANAVEEIAQPLFYLNDIIDKVQ